MPGPLPDRSRPAAPGMPDRAAGIGLRAPHYRAIVEENPPCGWLEIHPENYFGGGAHRHHLSLARALYPLSFHAVGLSLGSDQPVDEEHLDQIRELAAIYEPFQISDHASWSTSGNAHLNDLLPLPCTKETLTRLCANIDRVQTVLRRPILIENPSTYLSYTIDEMPEWDFLNRAARATGCGLLLDVNNIYVQSVNHGIDAAGYINNIDAARIGEIHLAGHTQRRFPDGDLLVDTHNRAVCPAVWALCEQILSRCGPVPVLIEWDADIPPLSTLTREAARAQDIINRIAAERQSRTHAAA